MAGSLSRNRGHQNALVAGLFSADGDAIVSIDADLQDDIGAISEMVDRFRAGAEVVYGVRGQRDSDSSFKRMTAEGFYRLIQALGAESIHNHADYRLMSRQAVESLKQYREVNLYLRGIVPFRSGQTFCRRIEIFLSQYGLASLRRNHVIFCTAASNDRVSRLCTVARRDIRQHLGTQGPSS